MTTSRSMPAVLGALLPGIFAMLTVWGWGVMWNLAWLSVFALLAEAALLAIGGERSFNRIRFQLTDWTALLSGWLIAICLPPFTDVYLLALAAAAGLALGKHVYGGLGGNIFNPAMVGYAVVLVSFPEALAHWPAIANDAAVDGLSGATLLSEFRYRTGLTTSEFDALFLSAAGDQQLIAASFLIGGLVLAYRRLLAWRIPLAVLAGVGLAALFGYDQGASTSLGSAWFHWTTGGTIAAAFFIATDPVTHPQQPKHQILFGLMIGVLIYLIRAYGSYPDGIAFAVLFANAFTPFLNRLAVPRTAGVQT